MVSNASAQMPMPNVSPWERDQKRLTPAEERERQKKLDNDCRSADTTQTVTRLPRKQGGRLTPPTGIGNEKILRRARQCSASAE